MSVNLSGRARKALVVMSTGLSVWIATYVSKMWGAFDGVVAAGLHAYLVPNDPPDDREPVTNWGQGDKGAVDPGSLALGMIAGLILGYLIWVR